MSNSSNSFLTAVASWPPSNYVNPETRGNGVLVASIIFGVLGTVGTVLRVYTRLHITRTFGADDVLIILATIFSLTMMIVVSIASAWYGWDRHIWDIPLPLLPTSRKYGLVFTMTFGLASALTKLSLLWFCRRILGEGRKAGVNLHDVAISVVMFIVGGFLVAYEIIELVQCRPLAALWDLVPTYPYRCIEGTTFILGASIANTITDLLATLIPMSLIATLHLPTRQRIAVISIFGLGVLVNIAGAFRTYYVHRSLSVTNLDVTWVGWPTDMSAIIEIGLGLIVASIPALRPLVNHVFPRLLEPGRRAYNYNYPIPGSIRQNAIPLASMGSAGDWRPVDKIEVSRTVVVDLS